MSSGQFNYNGHNSGPPHGSITAYLGTSDPDGWVICDGVQRTDGSDGRYNRLISAGMGSGTTNSTYTPPNLKGTFLYGSSTTSSVNGTGGASTVTLSTANLPAHNHTGTTDGMNANNPHNHQIPMGDKDDLNCTHGTGQYPLGDGPNTYATGCYVYSTDINHGHTFTTSNTGSGTAFSIMPPYVTVNYIIKY